ncbi:ABC transporter ATP-binding protein [Fictibacillus sp. 26RED30]|uniref:ABC transporter ATP-binding protein n=1 Tax=Fictibacillus sp. 26RED30 TaxID=2745877 RepID=UPI0018CD1CEE|nr:dipeptide/oligopeptide/nickel ABC transporter ATP-binding protein [Fictibacillus sp. 26RED30]MBH0160370.1 ABC transporter ATP-binding protein [Fictibacillus sp. 26RED30]
MLHVNSISKTYHSKPALRDISLYVNAGDSIGIIGESGSGKSTLGKIILGLKKPDQGDVYFRGSNLHTLNGQALKKLRRHLQIVFQDPVGSLNPKLPVWKSVVEPLENFPDVIPSFLKEVRHDRKKIAEVLFQKVGLSPELLERYPHQLSGGQKQRIAVARGISLEPDLLVCDEPTSSLDVSVQAQVLNLLKKLQRDLNLSFLFISHDIAAVQFMCERIVVLKDGILVDAFLTRELFSTARHPYTKMLVEMSMEQDQ